MENETMTTAQTAEETTDAFLDGWGDGAPETETTETVSEEPEQAGEAAQETPQAEAEPAEQQTAEKPTAPDTPALDAAVAEPEKAPDTNTPKVWTLRHMDETKTVDEQEITVLAQKGLDYDRIRTKYDEAKPVMEMFTQFAKDSGMTVAEYAAHIRMEAKRASGMDEQTAKRAVELEDREAKLAVSEAQAAEAAAEKTAAQREQTTAEERRKADIAEFQTKFPDAAKDPNSIPQEVWDEVKGGERLVTAYALYSMRKAQTERDSAVQTAQIQTQNAKNASRSTGSMVSAGQERKSKDPFEEGWGD